MTRIIAGMVVALLGVSVVGCTTDPNKEQVGTVVGGVLGGIVGHQVGRGSGRTVATIAGTLVGAVVGGQIGRYMDEQDRLRAAQVLETHRTGQPGSWRNPDTGNRYTVTPTRTYDTREGPCREYTMDARIGGRPEQVYGRACRQQDGSWKIVNR